MVYGVIIEFHPTVGEWCMYPSNLMFTPVQFDRITRVYQEGQYYKPSTTYLN